MHSSHVHLDVNQQKGFKNNFQTETVTRTIVSVSHSANWTHDTFTPITLGCMAHARRRFSDAVKAQGRNKKRGKAHRGLALIRKLYRIETAKANGLEPYAYLRMVFTELLKADTVEAIEAFLPGNMDQNGAG